jgi:hypothetical protein
MESFTLGGKRFTDQDVTYSVSDKGVLNDRFLAGNIGRPLMKPFKIVYDYSHNRIAFVAHG